MVAMPRMAENMLVARNYPVNGHYGPEAILAVCVVFTTVSGLAVIGRFFARRVRGIRFWVDDWLIIPALLCSYVIVGLTIRLAVVGGAGFPLKEHTQEELGIYTQTLAIIQFFFASALGLSKMSLCFLLIRIFPVKRFKFWAYLVLAYQVAWTLAAIFLGAFICRPFSYNWNHEIQGVCGNEDAMYVAVAVTDLIGDVVIAILPLPSIWSLKASVLKRLGLTAIFTLGILEIIVGIFRIIVLLRVTRATDFTLEAVEINYLSVMEPCLGVIIACAATLNPLLKMASRKVTESTRSLLSSSSSRHNRMTGQRSAAHSGLDDGRMDEKRSHRGEISRVLGEIDQETLGASSSEDLPMANETRRNQLEA